MKTQKSSLLMGLILSALAITLLTSISGCDIDFGGSNGGGNGGGGGNGESIVRGTITDISPDRDLDGITVQIEDGGVTSSDVTDDNGFFEIEGSFDGSLQIEFLDEALMQIALDSITVFPEAEVDLGDITITNGNVDFDDDGVEVTFEGTVTDNNCSGGIGTLVVTANDDDTEVVVEVSSSTDIIRDNDDNLDCEDVLDGDEVEVIGELLTGNSVEADRIEIL